MGNLNALFKKLSRSGAAPAILRQGGSVPDEGARQRMLGHISSLSQDHKTITLREFFLLNDIKFVIIIIKQTRTTL